MEANNPRPSARRKAYNCLGRQETFRLAQHIVQDQKRYLEPYLTLETLAEELNVHRNILSAAVNHYAGVIFPVWIATYRIAEVERLASLPENSRASIETLALKAGFANRTSFYRVYRSIKHSKPSETLKK